jgi:head-tail adaptor
MNIGDAVSSLTGGFWNGFATTSTGVSVIRGEKTSLMLSKLTTTVGASGGQVQVWANVQALSGSLQRTSGNERQIWSKETKVTDYKFYVDYSQFTSDANFLELKESSKLTQSSPSKTFDIVNTDNRKQYGFVVIFLQEKT